MRIPSWADTRAFAKCLTRKRLRNYYELRSSYGRARKGHDPMVKGMPMAISVEPTTACNLRCPECPSGLRSFSRPTGNTDIGLYRDLLDELGDYLLYLTLYFQGEPLIHPQFCELVRLASAKQIYTITSTNGHFLSPPICEELCDSGLSRLIISLDGASQETYQKYRISGDIVKVIEGTKRLAETKRRKKKGPHIVVQTIAFRQNESELEDIEKLSKEMQADEWIIKTAQVYGGQESTDRLPHNKYLRRYEMNGDNRQIINDLDNACWRMWHSAVITWDGKVVPCCFDKDAIHRLGDIQQDSFTKIWHGNRYKKMRAQIFENRKSIDICANCSEGCKVWIEPSKVM